MEKEFKITVQGIGYIGIGPAIGWKNGKNTKVYQTWRDMIRRCYSEKTQATRQTYENCSVDEYWHSFQNFAKWYNENYVEGYQLDKDILIKGNKIYSSDKCLFVPKIINTLFTKSNKSRGDVPIGVTKQGNKFIAQCHINGKRIYFGSYTTPEEAFNISKINKEGEIKRIANLYRDTITEQCYQAMINYQVEITD